MILLIIRVFSQKCAGELLFDLYEKSGKASELVFLI